MFFTVLQRRELNLDFKGFLMNANIDVWFSKVTWKSHSNKIDLDDDDILYIECKINKSSLSCHY